MRLGVEAVGPGLPGAYAGTFASPSLSLLVPLCMDLYAEKVSSRPRNRE